MVKNIGFLFKNVPFAGNKAEEHYCRAIEIFKENGMRGYLGAAYLSMGLLYKARKKTEEAKRYLADAINLFQECEAQGYLEQATVTLESISVADT